LQPDSNQPPTVGSDRPLAPSMEEPEKPRHKGVRAIVWIGVLVFFVIGFILVLRHSSTSTATATATPAAGGKRGAGGAGGVAVTSATAQKGNIGVYVDSIGTVTPVYTSSITSQVNGIVTVVHFTEGQMVNKGAALIDIDPRPYQATLLQSQGILDRDQGSLDMAKMDLARYQAAWARNAIPKQTLDDQEKQVQQIEGTVKNDQGTVQYDQIQVEFCHVVAPISGRVGLRLVDPGNVVQAGGSTVLAVITQIQPITGCFGSYELPYAARQRLRRQELLHEAHLADARRQEEPAERREAAVREDAAAIERALRRRIGASEIGLSRRSRVAPVLARPTKVPTPRQPAATARATSGAPCVRCRQ